MSCQVFVFFTTLLVVYGSVMGQPVVHSPKSPSGSVIGQADTAAAYSKMISEPMSNNKANDEPIEHPPKIIEPLIGTQENSGSAIWQPSTVSSSTSPSSSSSAAAAVLPDCNSIVSELNPCVSYITKSESRPSDTCCAGVKTLKKYNGNKAARQATCRCLESVAPMLGQIDYSLLAGLPKMCGVSVKLPAHMSATFDCSKA